MPIDTLNLNAMLSIGRHFDTLGYSDHSQGILASLVAATLGVTVIEKHVTLDRAMPGPDHSASIEPDTPRTGGNPSERVDDGLINKITFKRRDR